LKRKFLLYSLVVVVVLGALALYVGLNVRRELNAARGVLGNPMEDLSSGDVLEARKHLEAAEGSLSGPPATILRLIPLMRQNIQAVDAVVDAGLPVMRDALALTEARDLIGEEELVRDGRVRLDVLGQLSEPLGDQLKSLRALETELLSHRSGWLLPPLWDEVDDFARRARGLRRSVEKATVALEIAPSLLGADGRRTYLVLILNNAELRGAGGILSAVGTLTAREGRLALGDFLYYGDIATDEAESVPAPEDFERRFGRYRANTTTVVNATASPDVPEVATVAARLLQKLRGVNADGVLLTDPRGIASLLPPGSEITASETDSRLTKANVTDFIYSDSYEVLGGADPGRRSAILGVGRDAFEKILAGGSSGSDVLDSAGSAIAGGHIRFVSLDQDEQEILDRLGVTGNLTSDAADNLLVTVQNLGADKLDYWMRRHIEHKCTIEPEVAHCESVVRLTNGTPRGLNDYVSQIRNRIKRSYRYGVYLGYLELYVPDAADLTGVTLNGRVERFYPESENGRKSLGMYFSTPRGESTSVRVSYDLELPDSGYSLEITPQPLPFDADLRVDISGPKDWSLSGPGVHNNGRIVFQGELDAAIRFDLDPYARTGFSSLWATLVKFWTQPLG
jgi:Protein of unknown function (DUF4012)